MTFIRTWFNSPAKQVSFPTSPYFRSTTFWPAHIPMVIEYRCKNYLCLTHLGPDVMILGASVSRHCAHTKLLGVT